MKRAGVGYRHELSQWIDRRPRAVGCLEITAEHFFDYHQDRLKFLAANYPLFVHGLGLSLGTAGPLDPETLQRFVSIVRIADPLWVSEHIAFTRTSDVDLGHLNPLRPTKKTLHLLAAHAREMAAACEKPLILENITSHLQMDGDLSETDFLNGLCREADCGLLLDVTNLFINSRNHGFDPRRWLHAIDPDRIVQLHIVGYSTRNGRLEDGHSEQLQDDLLDLLKEVVAYAPVKAVILERDLNLQDSNEIESELHRLEEIIGKN